MANVLLTNCCVRRCSYCFASKHISEASPNDYMSWEDLIYIADLQEIDNHKHMSLLGGEPTIHPEYLDFVAYLVTRGFHVCTFTSGVVSEGLLREFEKVYRDIPPHMASFVCNLNDPELSPDAEVTSVKRFLDAFGPQVTPGFNIYRTDFSLEFLFGYISEFGLSRHMRLGVAHPIFGHDNQYISPEQMKEMSARLVSYFPLFEAHKVSPGLDCGFPLCAFSNDEIGWLYKLKRGDLHFGCGPAIDIGPDMSVWACFPLSSYHKRQLCEFGHMRDVRQFFEEQHHKVRVEAAGIYEECDECAHRESGLCTGGCLAHALNKMKDEPSVRALGELHR